MARAIEKGATYLDKLCHKFYDEPKGCGKKTDYVCRLCGGPLETYYCEERLYLVKCADCGTLALVKTANPEDSARVTLARPTLTPPNEWVSVKDAMPPEHEPVMCIVSGSPKPNIILDEAYQLGSWNKDDGWIIDEYLEWTDADVLWWRMLPVPPYHRPPEGEEET